MTIPFLKRIEQQGTTGHGNKSEERVARRLGANLQPASGAKTGAKSDFRIGKRFRFEAKSTTAPVLKVDLAWLTKIAKEALADGSTPVLTVSFVKSDGTPQSNRNAEWVMLPLADFHELIEKNG